MNYYLGPSRRQQEFTLCIYFYFKCLVTEGGLVSALTFLDFLNIAETLPSLGSIWASAVAFQSSVVRITDGRCFPVHCMGSGG